ncbi:uncharacterized protein EI97DRAFT_44361 [Westerdykella ornata]|uniref:Uncharacterized protein n=1 Tax=Westerdykella ornata TaxID=318751 RepID=A0A6A6JK11_WESOR|nr:uncharacterized protein EI97DRAFT_44361 [Westerdykella ornata]KAF2276565.1 hypothetical protein EI97DRAFT_44361 [Westerdykella ornata]
MNTTNSTFTYQNALFPHNPSPNASAWTFPPPVPAPFLRKWIEDFFSTNNPSRTPPTAESPEQRPQQSYYFEVEATKSGMGGKQGEFGSAEKVVRVGDVVELAWVGGKGDAEAGTETTQGRRRRREGMEKLGDGTREERVVRLRCVVCSLGIKEGGSVGDACEKCEFLLPFLLSSFFVSSQSQASHVQSLFYLMTLQILADSALMPRY